MLSPLRRHDIFEKIKTLLLTQLMTALCLPYRRYRLAVSSHIDERNQEQYTNLGISKKFRAALAQELHTKPLFIIFVQTDEQY
ncbi:MAG: hypothetical protein V4724_31805 [Pseudomonadota bacterium]